MIKKMEITLCKKSRDCCPEAHRPTATAAPATLSEISS
jgi:hypothetical protein